MEKRVLDVPANFDPELENVPGTGEHALREFERCLGDLSPEKQEDLRKRITVLIVNS